MPERGFENVPTSRKFSGCSYVASEKIKHRQAAKVENIANPELDADSADPHKGRSDSQGQARGVPRFPKDLDHQRKREVVAWSEVERRTTPAQIWTVHVPTRLQTIVDTVSIRFDRRRIVLLVYPAA
jgi:hypothetical protein